MLALKWLMWIIELSLNIDNVNPHNQIVCEDEIFFEYFYHVSDVT